MFGSKDKLNVVERDRALTEMENDLLSSPILGNFEYRRENAEWYIIKKGRWVARFGDMSYISAFPGI